MNGLAHSISIPNDEYLYRITSMTHFTNDPSTYCQVVNGKGAHYREGRYNHLNVVTVYLSDTPQACFCERSFYRLIEFVTKLDAHHAYNAINLYLPEPNKKKEYIIWEIKFTSKIKDIYDLTSDPDAKNTFGVLPSLMESPTQDYEHLKKVRGLIQKKGYQGIKVASCRGNNCGNIIVLFHDQSNNIAEIVPNTFSLSIIQDNNSSTCSQFNDFKNQKLSFTACEVGLIPPNNNVTSQLTQFINPQKVIFKR